MCKVLARQVGTLLFLDNSWLSFLMTNEFLGSIFMEINRRILVSLKQKILLLSLSTLLIPNVSHSTIAPEPGTGREFPEAFLEYKKNNPEKFRIKGGLKSKVERAKKARQDSKGKGQNQIEQGGLSSESSTSKAGPMPTAGLVSGTVSVPVILVQFSDVAATPPMNNPVTLQNILFGGAGTVTDYYNEVSYGNLSVTGSVSNLITLPGTAATYEGTTNGLPPPATLTLTGLLIKDALGGAGGADSTINFGAYDNDGPDGIPNSGDDDGVVDLIAFVQPKKGGECSGASIWSHRWQYRYWNGGTPYTTNDARSGGGFIQIDDYTVQPALNCSGTAPIEIGVFAHEFGHIFGIPDLYDTDSQPSQGLGYWSLMASGNWNTASQPAHWDAWSKSEVGWLTPTLLTSKITSLSIPQVETNPAAFEISISNSNYYLIENRQAVGFDANLQNCGLLIYRVDQATINNRTPSNQVNTVQNCGGFKQNSPDHYGIALAQADGLCQLEGNINRGDAGDPYPGSTSNLNFRNNTNPSSIDYEGNDPKVSVTTISNCAATMTANVDAFPLPTSAPGPVDVVFAVDISGSYVDDLPNIKAQMPAIVTKLRSAFINIRFGLASFKDFPFAPFGGSGDFAYLRNLALTTDSAAFLTAVNGLTAAGGGDTPESQYETIYQILTGAGRDLNNDGDKLDLGVDGCEKARKNGGKRERTRASGGLISLYRVL